MGGGYYGESMAPHFSSIQPSVFLKASTRGGGELEQLFHVMIEAADDSTIRVTCPSGERREFRSDAAEEICEIYLPEAESPGRLTFELLRRGAVVDRRVHEWRRPRRWRVHVVQLSHHDVGYTDLASNVLPGVAGYLDEALDHLDATAGFPEDAQFRLVVEQFWSLQQFVRTASSDRVERMIRAIKSGHVEVTALFGNMITEICGHEVLAGAAYPAFRFAREHGFRIRTAEHNDIPGFSWGLATVLTEAGIELFTPGLPLYYGWGEYDRPSFWDQQAVFGHLGPGAFQWEAQSGKRVLFYCNNSGCGGEPRTALAELPGELSRMEEAGYPYSVVRRPVQGALRDNSPYVAGYAETIRRWNDRWVFPHLISSTNSLFADELIPALGDGLPVHRGELPGQDYPLGALSTAGATAVNRRNHSRYLAAERASFCAAEAGVDVAAAGPEAAGLGSGFGGSGAVRGRALREAMEDMLWYDEHTWGYGFPAGHVQRTSELEKTVHAHRAAATIHDVLVKGLAAIADNVRVGEEGVYLLVFNPLPHTRSSIVRFALHEMENCGSEIITVEPEDDRKGEGYLKGVTLGSRGHVHPAADLARGGFTLLDVADGRTVEYELRELHDGMAPIEHAPGRFALGSGGPRIARMELPDGLKTDMVFRADSVPALGYRLYRLSATPAPAAGDSAAPGVVAPEVASGRDGEAAPDRSRTVDAGPDFIENEFYRVSFDGATGRILSVWDKDRDHELLDATCPDGFAELVVRNPIVKEPGRSEGFRLCGVASGPVCASFERSFALRGHPSVRQEIALYSGERRIDISMRLLKDPTPLLDVHCAFPFAVERPRFTYEGPMSTVRYLEDHLPGAWGDSVTHQNWIEIAGEEVRIIWASRDAPVAGLGALWPGRVSPAHCCIVQPDEERTPQRREDIGTAWIYSTLFWNNFGTNFSPYQSGDYHFAWSFTTAAASDGVSTDRAAADGAADEPGASAAADGGKTAGPADAPGAGPGRPPLAGAVRFGEEIALPVECLYTRGRMGGSLAPIGSFLSVDDPQCELLACKQAEDGDGTVLRVWNASREERSVTVSTPGRRIVSTERLSVTEDPYAAGRATSGAPRPSTITTRGDSIVIRIAGSEVVTARVRFEEGT